MKKMTLSLALALLASVAQAEDWYAGVQYSAINAELEFGGRSADGDANTLNFLVGYQLNDRIAIEGLVGGSFADPGDKSNLDVEVKSIAALSFVGSVPLIDKLNLYAKLGAAHIEAEDNSNDNADGSGLTYGVGTAFDITEQVTVHLEYVKYPKIEYSDFDIDIDSSAVSLGFYARF